MTTPLFAMVNQRPDPKTLKRKLLEIEHRYKAKAREAAKRNGRSRGMAAIRLAELTRWIDDTYGQGIELEPTDASYTIARIFAHHIGALNDAPRRITKWMDVYAPWVKPRDLERLITETQDCPLKWSADKLAWKIRLTDAKRTELKIRTIGAIDCSKDQRLARRRKRHAERQKALRAAKKAKTVRSI
jgi:hypothetical protein